MKMYWYNNIILKKYLYKLKWKLINKLHITWIIFIIIYNINTKEIKINEKNENLQMKWMNMYFYNINDLNFFTN
jgi:hypothetical protein